MQSEGHTFSQFSSVLLSDHGGDISLDGTGADTLQRVLEIRDKQKVGDIR